MDLTWLRNRSWLLYGLCVISLLMVLVPGLGVKVNGAQRWLGLGPLRVQPSEFAKLGIVLILASYFASNQRDKATLIRGFLLPSAIIGTFCVLIILQPDFGTCFLCGAVAATHDVSLRHQSTLASSGRLIGCRTIFRTGLF